MTSRLGSKAQEFINDKIGSKLQDKLGVGVGDLIPMLGGPQNQQQGTTQQQAPADPATQQPEQKADPRQQLFNGLMKELTR